jgi:hypothetical protein
MTDTVYYYHDTTIDEDVYVHGPHFIYKEVLLNPSIPSFVGFYCVRNDRTDLIDNSGAYVADDYAMRDNNCELDCLYDDAILGNQTNVCYGDDLYMSAYPNAFSYNNITVDCTCIGMYGNTLITIQLGELDNEITPAISSGQSIEMMMLMPDVGTGFFRSLLSFTGHEVHVNLEDTMIIIHITNGDARLAATVRKDDFFVYQEVNGSSLIIDLPARFFMMSSNAEVTVYVEGVIEDIVSIPIVGTQICRVSDCIWCADAFNNWHCVPYTYKILVILVIVVLGLCAICISPISLIGLWSFTVIFFHACKKPFLLCYGCFTSPMMKDCRQYFSIKWYRAKDYMVAADLEKGPSNDEMIEIRRENKMRRVAKEQGYGEPESDDESMAADEYRLIKNMRNKKIRHDSYVRFKSRYGTMGWIPLTILSLCVTQGLAQVCTDSSVIQGTTSSCVTTGQSTTCDVVFDNQITLLYPGSAFCFMIREKNAYNNGSIIATGHIDYTYYEVSYVVSTEYYTADWVLSSQSVHRCYDPFNENICSFEVCDDPDLTLSTNPHSELNDYSTLNFPGQSGCFRGCSGGLTDCGCFYATDGCIFWRYSIKPVGKIYKVMKIGTKYNKPRIDYTIESMQETYTGAVIGTTREIIANQFELNFIGTYTPAVEPSLNDYVMMGDDGVWNIDASTRNSPQSNTIGDIQAASKNLLMTSGINNFIYGDDLVDMREATKTAVFIGADPALGRLINSFPRFPFMRDGNLFSFWNNKVSTNLTQPGALVFNFATRVPISLTRMSTVVCPRIESSHATGCHSCVMGAEVTLEARSFCANGFVEVSADVDYVTIDTRAVMLTTTLQNVTIYLKTTQAMNDFKIIFRSGNYTGDYRVRFTAVSDINVIGQDRMVSQDYNPSNNTLVDFFAGDVAGFFDDIFKGIASWWQYLIFSIIGCVVLIIGSIAILYLLKWGISFWVNQKKKFSKYGIRKLYKRFTTKSKET